VFLLEQTVTCICHFQVYSWTACSFGLSAISQQYFSLRTNQPPAISQQYFSLTANQHQPSATSQTNRLKDAAPKAAYAMVFSGFAFIHFYVIIPALDRMEAQLEAQEAAWATMREEIKKSHERTDACNPPF
jgi:hypothetical protein